MTETTATDSGKSTATPPTIGSAQRSRGPSPGSWIAIVVAAFGAGCFTGGAFVLAASFLLPNLLAQRDALRPQREAFSFAGRATAAANISAIESALDEFSIANGGRYPDQLEWLVVPDVNGQTFLATRRLPLDPWGIEFRYDRPGPGGRVRVYSYGRDGRPGGEGDDADIDNGSVREGREDR